MAGHEKITNVESTSKSTSMPRQYTTQRYMAAKGYVTVKRLIFQTSLFILWTLRQSIFRSKD
ncbi:hypothetical protein VAZ01S_017_00700 [Vibrio azureus NBRC 104587]|uniref:Uncharacterized protein n=1 Tax=Vibrio azureus NBRC 104587 TaxID=1219077 RepID=U3C0D1_9VIBR|nr:hypothetical protein VAZ01S_017_00700 [Vibrio azureus NBRC 104587]